MAVTDGVLGVAVVGCGLIGQRRAAAAAEHPRSRLVLAVDVDPEAARAAAAETGAETVSDWRIVVRRMDVDAVAVCTPNGYLEQIAVAALEAGKHVLLEKPMGRNRAEAVRIAEAAERSGARLKVGFNHRYHPALRRARALVSDGAIGRVLNIRARYGHGSRPGCEREWRADPAQAGGGELTDQGVHVADLMNWFLGAPGEAFGYVQTAVWPIEPLEDNAFGLFRWGDGAVAQLHVSMTQWKNLFSFEVFGERGSVAVEGLGRSYGTERLVLTRRRMEGGVPEVELESFPGEDASWEAEWADFVEHLAGGSFVGGEPRDGVTAMAMVEALYRSAREGAAVAL